jgi:tryptophan synthase alpha chain
MKRIEERFRELGRRGEKALIPFIAAGDPSLETTAELVLEMERRGADLIELGIPFSDPLADGPVIQMAYRRALRNKMRLEDVLEMVGELRLRSRIPLILMSYYNLLHRLGAADFARRAAMAGVDGFIIPDLPPEEGEEFWKVSREVGLANILLITPTTSPERIRLIAEQGTGFLYYVSLLGVTGARNNLPADLRESLTNVKALTDKPVAVGFGVSTPKQAETVAYWADGVIVGSALVQIIQKDPWAPDLSEKVGTLVEQLKAGIRLATQKSL